MNCSHKTVCCLMCFGFSQKLTAWVPHEVYEFDKEFWLNGVNVSHGIECYVVTIMDVCTELLSATRCGLSMSI